MNKVEVKPSKTGMGVFAKIDIPANSPILEFTGSIVPKDKTNIDPSYYLQVNHNKVMGPSGATDDYVNHSCDPNCLVHIVGSRAILYSMYVIKAGTELTFDYSTSSTDTKEQWQMNCSCGSYKCRGVISGIQYVSEATRKEYEKKGMLPMFITMPNLISKE